MKLKNTFFIAAALVALNTTAHIGRADGPKVALVPQHNEVLITYLQKMGDKLNCYFTVETNTPRQLPEIISVPNTPVGTPSIQSLVADLHTQFPTVKIETEKDDQKREVIHLIDGNLKDVPDYVLSQKVDFKYDGPLTSLPATLGSQLSGRIDVPRLLNGQINTFGNTTTVKVKNQYSKAREILTGSAPPLSRVLWTARTQKIGSGWKTIVYYFNAVITVLAPV